MADEANEKQAVQMDEAQATEPHGEEAKRETDWKAEARKWEARAKENKAAAQELEALKQAQMSEQEKMLARAEKAEGELKQLKAERQHAMDVREVAEATGVPAGLLECCADRAAMEQMAKAYEADRAPAAPKAPAQRIVRDSSGAASTRDEFAEFASQFLNH